MLVSKGKLKAKMLEYFRQVEQTGEPLIVTDRGREVLEVRPIGRSARVEEVLATYRAGGGRGTAGVAEAILLEPLKTEWEEVGE
ncbi:MAG: type II toxin-antitoxin system prevent-host-death family antitoxin [Verrucomicrobiota bacterium]